MAQIDSLEIEISTSAQKAEQEIRKLSSALGGLAKKLKFDTSSLQSLSNLDGNNFKNLGDGIKTFADGMKQLQGIKKTDFNRVAAGVERLGQIDASNLATVGNALRPLADGINILSNANFNNNNLQSLINSLTRLSNTNIGNLSTDKLKDVGGAIKQLATDLSDAPKIQQSVISMTNAIASLARSGANIPTVSASLGQLGASLKQFMSDMSQAPLVANETIAFTQAIGTLASAGAKAQTTANNLSSLGTELRKVIDSLASAPNVSGNVVRLTSALASLTNSGSGVGRAANSIRRGLLSVNNSAISTDFNIKKLTKSMSGLTSVMKKTSLGVKSFARQLLSAMGIYVSIFGAIQGIKKSIDISSDLVEVQNVVDVTFGKMSSKVEEFTKNSIEQFGMSELSAKQYASRFQAMGTAMGIDPNIISKSNSFLNTQTKGYVGLSDSMSDVSLNLTKLTADMASFYNVEQKAVAEDLESIFTGQTRPLRTYGLDLTQATLAEWAMKNGLDADIKSMSQAEKTMLRYQYVLANTGAAQGDFARTSQTWANQTRILKQQLEQLGSVLGGTFINLLKPLVSALNQAMSHIIAFAQTVSNALGKIFGWKFEVNGGVAGDLEDGEDAAGGIAGDMEDAADSAKKLNKQLRAFDELNTINLKDKSGSGSGGAGGAGTGEGLGEWVKTDGMFKDYESDINSLYELGKYIGDALKNMLEDIDWDKIYEKARNFGKGLADFLNGLISPELFAELGKTVASAINTAFHFLDSFGEWFNWSNFGRSLGAGLNAFMSTLDWSTILSAARNWGVGLAKALNSFLSETDFYEVGATIANALNTAIEFALSFGETFNFTNLGKKLSDAVNGFFATFNFDDLAHTINTWALGLLNTIITFIDKTDWELIGTKIGEFIAEIDFMKVLSKVGEAIWKAINAAIKTWSKIFTAAPIETALVSLAVFPKLLKAITASKFITGLKNLASKFKAVATVLPTVASGLSGNVQSVAILTTQYPKLGKAVDVLSDSFQRMMFGFHYGDFFGGINAGITNIRNNLTGLQKGAITAVAGFAEFSIVSDTFEGLTLGTENLITGIAKIGTTVAVAAAAMYTALGPAGLAIAGIIGVVAGIKGINDAMQEIHAENVGNAICNALTNPGGVGIDELFNGFVDKINGIGESFSTISEKSSSLDSARKNVQDTIFEIDKIKTSLEAGAKSAEEVIPRLTELYNQLADAIIIKIGAAGDVLLSTFAPDGVAAKAFEAGGINAEEMKKKVVSAMSEQEKAVYDLKTELDNLRETDPTNPKIPELEAQMITMASGLGETDKAVEELRLSTENGLNWEDYLNNEGLDTDKLDSEFTKLRNAVINTRETAENEFNAAIIAAKEIGNEENYNELKSALPDALSYMNKLTADEALNVVNTLQNDAIGQIDDVIETAQSNWENMEWYDKILSGFTSEGDYVEDYVNKFKTNTIDPLDAKVETLMGEFGVTGAGYASDAMEEVMGAIFSTEQTNYGANIPTFATKLNGDWKSILDELAENNYNNAIPVGENVIKGAGFGAIDNVELFTKPLSDVSQQGEKVFSESMQNMAKENTDMTNTFSKNSESISGGLTTINDSMVPLSSTIDDTKESFNSFGEEVTDMCKNDIEPVFSLDKWNAMLENIKTAFDTKWGELKAWWQESTLCQWWEEDVTPWFTVEKWSETLQNIATAFSDKWNEIVEWWNGTAIVNWWNNDVTPWFTKEKWIEAMSGIKEAFESTWNAAISSIKTIWNTFANWLNEKLTWTIDPVVVMGTTVFEGTTINLGRIPTFQAGGYPEDGLFMANHGELVGKFSNGKTAVANNEQITEGIAQAIYPAVYNAVSSAMNNDTLMRQQNELLRAILQKPVLDKDDIFNAAQAVYKGEATRRYGQSDAFDPIWG